MRKLHKLNMRARQGASTRLENRQNQGLRGLNSTDAAKFNQKKDQAKILVIGRAANEVVQ